MISLRAAFIGLIGMSAIFPPALAAQGNLTDKPLFIVSGETDRLYPARLMDPFLETFRRVGVEDRTMLYAAEITIELEP